MPAAVSHRPLLPGLLILLVLVGPAAVHAQSAQERALVYGSGMGFTVQLTNSGFGLGGYVQRAVSPRVSLALETSLAAGKDEREVVFFDFLGRRSIPRKANFFLMMPVHAGLQRRIFQDQIQDNFRPYLQVLAGPTLGWEYPYFEDADDDAVRDPDERTFDTFAALPKGDLRLGWGGFVGLGAHFGLSRKVTQGLRIGYAFSYFPAGIQLLEADVQEPQSYFGSPTISLTFGKLF